MAPYFLQVPYQCHATEAQAHRLEEEEAFSFEPAQESEQAEEEEREAEDATDWDREEEEEEQDKSWKDQKFYPGPTFLHRRPRAHHHMWGESIRSDRTPQAHHLCEGRCPSPL